MSKSIGLSHPAGLNNPTEPGSLKPISNRIRARKATQISKLKQPGSVVLLGSQNRPRIKSRKASKPIMLSKVTILITVLLLALVTVSLARIMYGEAVNKFFQIGTGSVELVKYERDLSGNTTDTTIPEAEFHLYKLADNPEQSDTQIGGRYFTDENGKITVNSLQPGNYYFKEITPAPNWIFDKDGDNTIDTYPFTITVGKTTEVVTAYNIRLTASLTIIKTVENKDGSPLTAGQRDAIFEFSVTFSDGGSYAYAIDGKEQSKLGNGGTLYLKHGQEAVFANIPVGVLYTVRETPSSHFSIESTDHQGTMTEDSATASFVNSFDSLPIYLGSLILTLEINDDAAKSAAGKTQESGEMDESESNPHGGGTKTNDISFDFTVHFANLPAMPFTITIDGKPVLVSPKDNTLELSLKDGEQAVIEGLPEGTIYTATQADYSSQGYIAAPSSYSGQTIQDEIILPFVNVRDVEDEYSGSLLVTKTVINAGAALSKEQREKQFDITLTFTNVPKGLFEIRIGDEVVELSKDNHEFAFALKHEESILVEGIPRGVEFDVKEAAHSDYIGVIAEATGTISAGHTTKLGLVNLVHDAPEPPALTSLTITKEVEGRVPEGDENKAFFFNVDIEGYSPVRIELKAGESMEFSSLPAGVYYEVSEEDASGAGYALISVTGGSGTLNETPNHAIFTNTYIRVITVEISGEKTWDTGIYPVDLPSYITVLLKDGNTVVDVADVRSDAEGNWRYTFVAPKYNERDEEISYTIDERDIPGYSKEIDGYNIKNTLSSEPKITIKGQKRWNTGEYNVQLPASITVLLKANGTIVDSVAVVPGSNGLWSYNFEAPKYDSQGRPITYTVDEVDVPNYCKSIAGYNITNTYVPPTTDTPNPGTQYPGTPNPGGPTYPSGPGVTNPETLNPAEPGSQNPGKEKPTISIPSVKWPFKSGTWDIGFVISGLLIACLIAAGLLALLLWKRALILPFARRRKDEEDELWLSPVALRKLSVAFRKS